MNILDSLCNSSIRPTLVAGALAAVAAVGPLPAQQVVVNALGETAGDDVSLLYAGVEVHASDTGLSPFLGVSGYRLWTDGPDSWQFNPAAGLRYGYGDGFVAGSVGYAFIDTEDGPTGVGGSPFFGGSEDGLTTSGIVEHWGHAPWRFQALASGNWGSDFLYTQARISRAVARTASGSVGVGVEGVWQADMDDDDPLVDGFESLQGGALVEWRGDGGVAVFGSGGVKDTNFGDATWYTRLGMTLVR